MSKLGFGIIGRGGITHTHAQAILHIEDTVLAAYSSHSLEKPKNLSEDSRCVFYNDYHEMLKRPEIDIVNICTPSGMHEKWP